MSVLHLEHTIDAGHRIVGHKGKCANLHGHTYKIEVDLKAPTLIRPGFVLDFGDIKDLLNKWDHKMILWIDDPLWGPSTNPTQREVLLGSQGCICVSFNPTAENMVADLTRRLHEKMIREHQQEHGDGKVNTLSQAYRTRITVWETPKGCAWAELVGISR